ncbi:MAG: ribonuclease III domain-containing protein, partial [Clostridia bacterium]
MSDVVAEVQAILGYTFKKTELLVRALTHNSGVGKGLRQSYQNLEFLGDSILNFVIAEELLRRHPEFNEGQLTRMRSAVVSEKPLAETIYKLGLSDFLIMGVSETKMHINQNSSVMEDMFEAIVGAIYLDGGMSFAKKFILTTLEPILLRSETDKNDFLSVKIDRKKKVLATVFLKAVDFFDTN